MAQPDQTRIVPYGDCAFLVEFSEHIDRAVSEQILALKERVDARAFPGLVETVPTFKSLLVRYDPLQTDFHALSGAFAAIASAATPDTNNTRRHWRVPVCYEEDHAPDLASVAETLGVTGAEVLERHLSVTYHVYMIGFVAGYPYLGDLPESLSLPRRADPRVRVPAGSIAIALTMAAIYPVVSPGGWHLIGQTPIKLFDPSWDQPALFAPGDQIDFQPINAAEYARLRDATEHEAYRLEPEAAR